MRINDVILIFIGVCCFLGCNKNSEKSTATTDSSSLNGSSATTDNNDINEPVSIAGAFLTGSLNCSIQNTIYCGLFDDKNKPVSTPSGTISFMVTLADGSQKIVTSQTVNGSSNWNWQIDAADNSDIAANNFAGVQKIQILENGQSPSNQGLTMDLTIPPPVCSTKIGSSPIAQGKVTFQNFCDFPVDFTWISFSCGVDHYGINTQPGSLWYPSTQQQPEIGDRWYILRTATGKVVEEWDVKTDPGQPYTYQACAH